MENGLTPGILLAHNAMGCLELSQKSQECQKRGDEIHTSHQSLHPIVAPHPFYSWELDFIGPINPPLKDVHRY